MDKPLVSICCITYNQSKYINECLDSFLSQETSFSFEILIHDDASEDGTAEIIKSYENEYGDIIKPIYQTINQYSLGNGPMNKLNFARAKGKYIAMCEGDDYWTDPLKLQKQVDFLEANKEYSSCAHTSDSIYMLKNGNSIQNEITTSFVQKNKIDFDKDVSVFELFSSYPFQTATFMMRRYEFEKKKTWFNTLKQGDINLFIILGSLGKIRKFKEAMSVYRIHANGISSNWHQTNDQVEERPEVKTLRFSFDQIKGLLKLRGLYCGHLSEVNEGINKRIFQYIDQSVNEKQIKYYLKFLFYYLKVNKIHQIRYRWLLGSFKKILFHNKKVRKIKT